MDKKKYEIGELARDTIRKFEEEQPETYNKIVDLIESSGGDSELLNVFMLEWTRQTTRRRKCTRGSLQKYLI